MGAHRVGEVGWVAVAFLGADLLVQDLAYRFALYVDCGHYYVARGLPEELHDALAKVSFYGIYTVCFQVGRHAALLGEHRFALHQIRPAMLLDYVQHRAVHLLGICSPVHYSPIGCSIALKFLQVVC